MDNEISAVSQCDFKKSLLDDIPGGIGVYEVIDGKASLSYLNNAYYNMLGMSRESRKQYYGTEALKAIHPDDRHIILEGIQKMIRGDDAAELLHRVSNKDGDWIWVNLVASVVERRDNYLKVYASFSNCDEMIRTQEELHSRYEDQVRYNRMISADSVGSSMVNLTKKTITMQDTEDKGILNVITQQTPQEGFETMYPCIPDEAIRKEYACIFDSDNIEAQFEKGIDSRSIRHPYMTFDCWLESSYNAVKNPKTGDLEVYCVAKDVSEDELQKDVTGFLMSHSYDDAMLINPQTGEPRKLIDSGKSAVYEEQKSSQDYSRGLENYFLKYSADDNPLKAAEAAGLAAVKKALENQEIYTISYSVYDAQHRTIHKRASYSYLNRYKTLILCTVQDITSAFEKEAEQRRILQKALADAEKANQEKSSFLSRMSHDMRTPLNGIIGMSQLAEDNDNPPDTEECLKKINISSEFLLGLINDVLDMERIESGKIQLNLTPYSGDEFTQYIEAVVSPLCRQKNINFKYTYGGSNDFVIMQDKLRINQIYFNLLSNAAKFTHDGGNISFHTEIRRTAHSVILDVTISDDGIGMSREFQEHMFEPFSQENQNTMPIGMGTGLGLAIVKRMCDLMEMKISVKSELGEGTTFFIQGEYQLATDDDRIPPESENIQEAPQLSSLEGRKILVCEDHPLNQEIIKRILERKGMVVVMARDGKCGVDLFEEAPLGSIAAILMDIRMPVMDGLQATRIIRSSNKPDAKTIPIIALTANAYQQDIRKCEAAGMDAHLAKPIDSKKIYAALLKFVK